MTVRPTTGARRHGRKLWGVHVHAMRCPGYLHQPALTFPWDIHNCGHLPVRFRCCCAMSHDGRRLGFWADKGRVRCKVCVSEALRRGTCQCGSKTGREASQPAVAACLPDRGPHPSCGSIRKAQSADCTVDGRSPDAPAPSAMMCPTQLLAFRTHCAGVTSAAELAGEQRSPLPSTVTSHTGSQGNWSSDHSYASLQLGRKMT